MSFSVRGKGPLASPTSWSSSSTSSSVQIRVVLVLLLVAFSLTVSKVFESLKLAGEFYNSDTINNIDDGAIAIRPNRGLWGHLVPPTPERALVHNKETSLGDSSISGQTETTTSSSASGDNKSHHVSQTRTDTDAREDESALLRNEQITTVGDATPAASDRPSPGSRDDRPIPARAVTSSVATISSEVAIEQPSGLCPVDNFIRLSDRQHSPANHQEGPDTGMDDDHGRRRIPPVLYQTGKNPCVPMDLYQASIVKWFASSSSSSSSPLSKEDEKATSGKNVDDAQAVPSSPAETLSSSPPMSLSYRFFDDEAMDAYLYDDRWSDVFPTLSLALRCIDHAKLPVMKADLWRYLILWENGGIFADLDVLPHPDLVNYLIYGGESDRAEGGGGDDRQELSAGGDNRGNADDAVFVLVDQDNQRVLSQWFLAASPKHPLMHYAIQEAAAHVLRGKRAIPIQQTGPRALYVATDRFLSAATASSPLFSSRELQAGVTYYGGYPAINGTADPTQHTNQGILVGNSNVRRSRSFRVLPSAMARNDAVRKEKTKGYKLMNMTHYRDRPSGKVYGGKTCLEFLNGTYPETSGPSPSSFVYQSRIYNFSTEAVFG
jgi:hypothetical protein